MRYNFENKAPLITGAAPGIDLTTAKAFAPCWYEKRKAELLKSQKVRSF
jgi:NAD(P)-dependent dehydrogenase (short-subunit alcohol dehydrogenase family)